jgi:putative phage-type endonuclease
MISLKPNKYRIVDLVQGSPEWHKFRSSHLGASETPIIMIASPYKTPFRLWQEKLGESDKEQETDNMRAGTILEPEIRAFVEDETDIIFVPVVLECKDLSWMSASLDGFDETQTVILECKLNNKENHSLVKNQQIPVHHFYQVQKQLLVSDAEYCIYASKHGDEILMTRVMPDKTAMNEIIDAEKEFWDHLINFTSPNLSDKDLTLKDDKEWLDLEKEYAETCRLLDPLEDKKKILGDSLERLCGGQSSIGREVKVSIFTRKGCVDYARMAQEFHIDVEKYRNSPKKSRRIDLI